MIELGMIIIAICCIIWTVLAIVIAIWSWSYMKVCNKMMNELDKSFDKE